MQGIKRIIFPGKIMLPDGSLRVAEKIQGPGIMIMGNGQVGIDAKCFFKVLPGQIEFPEFIEVYFPQGWR